MFQLFFAAIIAVTILHIAVALPPSEEVLDTIINTVKHQKLSNRDGCDQASLTPALILFFGHFGFGNGSLPANESVFQMALDDYITYVGVTGWTDVKGWWTDLVDSTGSDNFYSCIQWQNIMMNFNLSDYNAKFWSIEFQALDYDLGAGFFTLTHNWYCIQGVSQHLGPSLKQCSDLYDHQQQLHPERLCQNIADYLYCIERPYAQYCGTDSSGLICYGQRIAYQTLYPECNSAVSVNCQGHPLTF